MNIDEIIAVREKTEFRNALSALARFGELVSPRGQLVKELENFSCTFSPWTRFQSFECRKLNLDYIRDEFLWYLKGDRYDLSICEKAKIWKGIVNKDQSLNSNYGQYIFGPEGQFDRVVNTLMYDRDSRRASMMILGREHVMSDTNDLPCTYAIGFRIRNNQLNMSVHMRSQDAIYGMGNDVPTFSFIHEMVLNALRDRYPTLQYGTYFHVVDSFHVYERHFKMLGDIVGQVMDEDGCYRSKMSLHMSPHNPVICPHISGPDEVSFIRKLDFSAIPEKFCFARWLIERRPKRNAEKDPQVEQKE